MLLRLFFLSALLSAVVPCYAACRRIGGGILVNQTEKAGSGAPGRSWEVWGDILQPSGNCIESVQKFVGAGTDSLKEHRMIDADFAQNPSQCQTNYAGVWKDVKWELK